ncbi:MAG: protein kinase [Clostridia bacterium]|nr:protein kinase [Clostridia bacterium]
MIGRVISGRYVVEAVVGTGGMAVVYRAFDKIKKQTVAIKVLRPEYESDGEFVRRFSREAEAASKVSHENIVNMLDVGMDGEIRYIVMEFVDGQTLKEMIRENGRINPDVALRMTIRILAAVDHAHRNGIIHRDIKPQNIMVDRHGRVKVADFGIARLKAAQTTRIDGENGASALGSVHYFSPEQARGEVADEKSDLYSVGVCMYEMLTGQVPFDGETSVSVALKHVSEEPKSMRLFQNGISKAMDEVVMRALCKDKTRRYQSAAEMAADLRKTITHPRGGFVKYSQDEEPVEKPKEPKKRKQIAAKKKAAYLTAMAATTAALAVLLLAGWFFIRVYDRTTVPYVIGQHQNTALEMLDDSRLLAVVESVYSEEYEAGYVVAQSAMEGSRVRRGSQMTLYVSAGTQWFYMENYVGKTEEEAMASLGTGGAKNMVFEYVQNGSVPVGQVISQSPDPGYQSKDDPVVIVVSGQSVLMPALTGLSLEGATALIEAEGLAVGNVTAGYSADAVANTVIAQGIAPNASVLKGTSVDLTVSQHGETIYYPPARFTVVVPLDGLQVEVELTTPSGQTVIAYANELSAGTYPIELSSSEMGMHTVQVRLDGVPVDITEVVFD